MELMLKIISIFLLGSASLAKAESNEKMATEIKLDNSNRGENLSVTDSVMTTEAKMFIKSFTGSNSLNEWTPLVTILSILTDSGVPLETRTSLYLQSSCGARRFQYAISSSSNEKSYIQFNCENKCIGHNKTTGKNTDLPESFCNFLWKDARTVKERGL